MRIKWNKQTSCTWETEQLVLCVRMSYFHPTEIFSVIINKLVGRGGTLVTKVQFYFIHSFSLFRTQSINSDNVFLLDPDQTTYINLVIVPSFCLCHGFPSSTNSNTPTLEISHLFPKMWNIWGLERRIKQRRFGKIPKWKWECQIVQFVDSFQKKLWNSETFSLSGNWQQRTPSENKTEQNYFLLSWNRHHKRVAPFHCYNSDWKLKTQWPK